MQDKKDVVRVNFNVPASLYAEYKIALLRRTPRQNVSQHLLSVMREIVAQDKELQKKEGSE